MNRNKIILIAIIIFITIALLSCGGSQGDNDKDNPLFNKIQDDENNSTSTAKPIANQDNTGSEQDVSKKNFINKTFGEGNTVLPSNPSELQDVEYRGMVSIDGGTFVQDSIRKDKKYSFEHKISSFHIAKYEVTYELWYEVRQWAINNDYKFANAGSEGDDGKNGANPTPARYEPVTVINWRDAIVWCNAYSEMSGLETVYYDNWGNILKDSRDSNGDGCDYAEPDWNANGYRLPTEGEWQFAASNKGSTPFNYASGASADYKNSSATGRVAWYDGNSGYKTHPVGTKEANALGLHDMSGSVWEWCWDWLYDYPTVAHKDYTGPASGSSRVIRGGSWYSSALGLRVGFRNNYNPYDEYSVIGFRVARRP